MKYPFTLHLFTLVLLLLLLTVAAQAQQASFSFVVPGKVVYDVPFSVQLQLNTGGEEFIAYDLSVGTNTGQAIVGSGLSRADTFLSSALTKTTGSTYRVVTDTNGNVMTTSAPTTLFTLTDVRFQGTGTGGKFVLLAQPRKVTHSTAGQSYTVSSTDSNLIAPSLSVCGDGVVGYVDSNSNGIKDSGEAQEACDTALSGGTGCSDDCTFIRSTHKIQGQTSLAAQTVCPFGSTSCTLSSLTAKERLKAKLNAIFDLSCFPYAGHPETAPGGAGFCLSATDDDDGDGQPDDEEPFVQLPLLLKALREFYQSLGKL